MEISPEIIDLCQSALEQELKNTRIASKRLNEAMKNGVQDIELLCQLSDPLMDSMLGFSGKGKRTYLKFIKYVESFDPMTAEKIRDGFEDALGYKTHAVYVAARIAKEWHQGHTDKGGVDYFEGHLAMVAQLCFDWKAKTVAFLHDVAEDTAHTVKDVIKEMKKMLKEIKSNPEGVEWFDEYEDMIGIFPNESYHPLTKKEWAEIDEALNVLNYNAASDRESYIQGFKGNDLAIIVKLNDLRHNMDLSRIPSPTEEDIARIERYQNEYMTLVEFLNS